MKLLVAHIRSAARIYKISSPVKQPSIRKDKGGDGHFGAIRVGHTHQGIDLANKVGEQILSPIRGVVSKIGWTGKINFRFVELSGDITLLDLSGTTFPGEPCKIRLMYVIPLKGIGVGTTVEEGDVVATADDLHRKGGYPKSVGQHIHVEIRVGKPLRVVNPQHLLPGLPIGRSGLG